MRKYFHDWFALPNFIKLDFIRKQSKNQFKQLVKKRAKEFAFKELMKKKTNLSKLRSIHYDDLEIQPYLVSDRLTLEQKRTVFQFRIRVANFGENYRGGREVILCPLCKDHPDTQEAAFSCCEAIKANTHIEGEIADIYTRNIDSKTVKSLCNIVEFRKKQAQLS